MVEIMTEMHTYVPTISQHVQLDVEGESPVTVKCDHFQNVLLGGDQLTLARARGAQRVRENSTDGSGRLGCGFFPNSGRDIGRLCPDAIAIIRAVGIAVNMTKHLFGRLVIALWQGNASLWSHHQPTIPSFIDGLV